MSKCAQNMLGKLLALDMKPLGIAICNLHPGFMKTSMTKIYADKYEELGAIGPEEAAPGIVKVQCAALLVQKFTSRPCEANSNEAIGRLMSYLKHESEMTLTSLVQKHSMGYSRVREPKALPFCHSACLAPIAVGSKNGKKGPNEPAHDMNQHTGEK